MQRNQELVAGDEVVESSVHDRAGCAVAGIADLQGRFRHETVEDILRALYNQRHRGARLEVQEDDGTWSVEGDGSGILANFDSGFVEPWVDDGKHIPEGETPSVGILFLPKDRRASLDDYRKEVDDQLLHLGLEPLGWRVVDTFPEVLGRAARETAPEVVQFAAGRNGFDDSALLKKLWEFDQRVRFARRAEPSRPLPDEIVSFGNTVTYKVYGTVEQLKGFYKYDLTNPNFKASIAIGHNRWATIGNPDWRNPHPFSHSAANGHFNSVARNRNAVRSNERAVTVREGFPVKILSDGASDSYDFDRLLRYLTCVKGWPLEEALRRMMPPAWWHNENLPEGSDVFFDASRRELGGRSDWAGPGFVLATDGRVLSAVSDSIGRRPSFFARTKSGLLLVSSDAGAFETEFNDLLETGHNDAGDLVIADTVSGELLWPKEANARVLGRSELAKRVMVPGFELPYTPLPSAEISLEGLSAPENLARYGWNADEVDYVKQWLTGPKEPRGSMGRDWVPAVLSKQHPTLLNYAYPILANCTSPANNADLEAAFTDWSFTLGKRMGRPYKLDLPILTPGVLRGMELNDSEGAPKALRLDCYIEGIYDDPKHGGMALKARINEIIDQAISAVKSGDAELLILSHRGVDQSRLPIDTSILTAALNERLSREAVRGDARIVDETVDIRDRHELVARFLLGADAVCPTAIFAIAKELGVSEEVVLAKLKIALMAGASLAGLPTFEATKGSKLLEFVGLGPQIMEYFPGIDSKIGGLDFADLYEDMIARYNSSQECKGKLPKWKEVRRLDSKVAGKLYPAAVSSGSFADYQKVEDHIASSSPHNLGDLFDVEPFGPPLDVSEVMEEDEIAFRYFSGAQMSFGSLSAEAHEALGAFWDTLAVKFKDKFPDEIGCTNGSGEGGEEAKRSFRGERSWTMSRDRELASGRYGSVPEFYADPRVKRITIKIHQGAKGNEGADNPKNPIRVAIVRHTAPGTRLRSPVTNFDLFSVEAFGELVTLMKELNPNAEIIIKYISGSGTEFTTMGVLKSGNDANLVTGGEGGTGSSSKVAIAKTGMPREFGIAGSHAILVKLGLDNEIRVDTDGGILVSDDVIKSWLIGGIRLALGNLGMIGVGCGLLRRCHIAGDDGCAFGVATQNEELRRNFLSLLPKDRGNRDLGEVEKIYLGVERLHNLIVKGLARAVRLKLAALGGKSPEEFIGRTEKLKRKVMGDKRLDQLDLSCLTDRAFQPGDVEGRIRRRVQRLDTVALNRSMVDSINAQLADGKDELVFDCAVSNFDQAIGTRLAGEMVRRPDEFAGKKIRINAKGYAGFGCFGFSYRGMTNVLEGFGGSDFGVGAGEGSILVARPPRDADTPEVAKALLGPTALYGATECEFYIRGGVGPLFGGELHGAMGVHEGSIDISAYMAMTSGTVVELGNLGLSPFSGMTGGTVYCFENFDLEEKVKEHGSVDVVRTLTPAQELEIQRFLQKHVEWTDSKLAKDILANWDAVKDKFAVVTANREKATSQIGVAEMAVVSQ